MRFHAPGHHRWDLRNSVDPTDQSLGKGDRLSVGLFCTSHFCHSYARIALLSRLRLWKRLYHNESILSTRILSSREGKVLHRAHTQLDTRICRPQQAPVYWHTRAPVFFWTTHSDGSKLRAEMLAINCVRPSDSRIKIYMLSRSTSFQSLRTTMILGSGTRESKLNQVLDKMHALLNLVLGREVDDLHPINHRTGGLEYCTTLISA